MPAADMPVNVLAPWAPGDPLSADRLNEPVDAINRMAGGVGPAELVSSRGKALWPSRHILNIDARTIPPHSFAEVVRSVKFSVKLPPGELPVYYEVKRPTRQSITGNVIVTGAYPIAAKGWATASYEGDRRVKYTVASGRAAPELFASVGTRKDSYELDVDGSGFIVVGVLSDEKIAIVREVAPGVSFFDDGVLLDSDAKTTLRYTTQTWPLHTGWESDGDVDMIKREAILVFGRSVPDMLRVDIPMYLLRWIMSVAPLTGGQYFATMRVNLILRNIIDEMISDAHNPWYYKLLTWNLANYGYRGATHGSLYGDPEDYDDNAGYGYPVIQAYSESGTAQGWTNYATPWQYNYAGNALSLAFAAVKRQVFGVHVWFGGSWPDGGEVGYTPAADLTQNGDFWLADTRPAVAKNLRGFAMPSALF